MKNLAQNKKALYDYDLLREFQAGIMLQGWEVKSAKTGRVSLKESYVDIIKDEVFLINANFPKWPGMDDPEVGIETQKRKLLLNKLEIERLAQGKSIRGNTVVVKNLHLSRGRVKAQIALATGRKKYDKRQRAKQKDLKKQIDRDLSGVVKY